MYNVTDRMYRENRNSFARPTVFKNRQAFLPPSRPNRVKDVARWFADVNRKNVIAAVPCSAKIPIMAVA